MVDNHDDCSGADGGCLTSMTPTPLPRSDPGVYDQTVSLSGWRRDRAMCDDRRIQDIRSPQDSAFSGYSED